MKNMLKINLMVALLLVFCAMSTAQNQQQRMSREQLAEKQAKHIARELAFDETTAQKFLETYCAYQQEMWALGPRHKAKAENEEEAEQAIKERFERSQQILDLREKYYEEYSKFLTQKQIQRVYELERQAMNRLEKHHRHGQKGPKAPKSTQSTK